MADSIDLPEIGPVSKDWVIAGGALVAGIVGVAWWRHRTAAAAPVVADPTTGTNSTNPTYTNPAPVFGGDSTAQLPPTTDQEWTARVMAALSWLEPGYLGDVLGKYLGRQPLSLEEAAVVRAAWASQGKPPSNTSIILSQAGSTPGTTTPPASKDYRVTVEGQHVDQFAHYYGMSVADLYVLNPGIAAYVTWANNRGYLSPTNPANGTEVQVFGSAQTVRIR